MLKFYFIANGASDFILADGDQDQTISFNNLEKVVNTINMCAT